MPELPEVEITRRGITPALINQTIKTVTIRNASLRWPIPKGLDQFLVGQKIEAITRRAKYLLLKCTRGFLIIHLGMSGSLRISFDVTNVEKHDHFDLEASNGAMLRYRDPRRFGTILWSEVEEIAQHPLLASLGVEPLSDAFHGKMLYEQSRHRDLSVKAFLMNHQILVGVGNIYANEALFHAGICPTILAKRISLARYEKLANAIKTTLNAAIDAGGSSLRDFVNSEGKPGYFQQYYWVYGRGDEPCRNCGQLILKIKQGQRSSFYCRHCQK